MFMNHDYIKKVTSLLKKALGIRIQSFIIIIHIPAATKVLMLPINKIVKVNLNG
jgi:hypothetical protein